jgi:mono/diheme cytochrome c family protein
MKLTVAVVFTTGLVVAHPFYGPATHSTPSAQGAQSVWDGVFTEDQAKRGEDFYSRACAACHGQDLMGGEMAPGLADPQFRSNWDGVPVGELFERIRVSMPADNPGGLTRQQYADVLAFVFSRSGFPKGTTELSTRTEMLQLIMFKALKP